MPRSPLPPRHGLDAAWVRTPDRAPGQDAPWTTLGEFLHARLAKAGAETIDRMLARGDFIDEYGVSIGSETAYRPNLLVWFHRELRDEAPVPFDVVVLHQDERIVVVDKPHFLSTIPRGRHVLQSVVVRMRNQLGLPQLAPAHRLDRLTAGVLLLTVEQQWRAPYQQLFEQRRVIKSYRALADWRDDLSLPLTVRNRIDKQVGQHQARIVDGPVNAETTIELAERRGDRACYQLSPRTGRTHQLRLHLHGLGIPIVGDPLYPVEQSVDIDDFRIPLQLLASRLTFTDPVDGTERRYESARQLDWDSPGFSSLPLRQR